MDVVGHDAYLKHMPIRSPGALNKRFQNDPHGTWIVEDTTAIRATERNEIDDALVGGETDRNPFQMFPIRTRGIHDDIVKDMHD